MTARKRVSQTNQAKPIEHANQLTLALLQPDTLLTTIEAAIALRLHYRTLEEWRKAGIGPRALRMGRLWRYRVSDLLAYLDNPASVA